MIRKRVENIEEIRAYIKLGLPLLQIISAFGKVYGYKKLSYGRDHKVRQICSKICCNFMYNATI